MYVINLQHLKISKLSHFCLHNTWRWLNVTKCCWFFMLHIGECNITNTSCPIFYRGSVFVSLFQSKQLKQNKSCWFNNTIWCWLNMQQSSFKPAEKHWQDAGTIFLLFLSPFLSCLEDAVATVTRQSQRRQRCREMEDGRIWGWSRWQDWSTLTLFTNIKIKQVTNLELGLHE